MAQTIPHKSHLFEENRCIQQRRLRTGGYMLPISQSDRSQKTFLNNDMPTQEHRGGRGTD